MISMDKNERPNIVFLMLDTLSADHLKMYGGDIRMRNLEKIAEEGTTYKNAIAPGTYTLTSHASLFTGRRVKEIKSLTKNPVINHSESTDPLFLKNKYIKDQEPTIAARLSYLGYKTALFSNNPFVSSSTGLGTGFSYLRNIFMENKLKYHKTTLKIIANDFLRENLTRLSYYLSSFIPEDKIDDIYVSLRSRLNRKVCAETGAYILDQGAMLTNSIVDDYLSKTGDRNHFLFLNYMEAHEGYPTNIITDKEVSQDRWMYVSGMIDGHDVRHLKSAYATRLEYLDTKIGRMMSILKVRGILDNAVVIFASDHGQAFMEHGQLYHTLFPYNEISHVPLVTARYLNGKQVTDRKTIENPVSIKSLYNSILDIGYRKADRVNGAMLKEKYVFSDHTGMLDVWDIPLLKMFKDRSKNAEILYKTKLRYNNSATAVYYNNYKLIHYYGGRIGSELYNIREDPRESTNIIGENRQLAKEMLSASIAS